MFEKAKILIVDDMPEHIAFAGTILRNEGFRVLGATSAKAALKMMEKSKPHLVLLNIKMEGMDGLELCRHFKSDEETKEIPVIFMTSESDPAMIKKGFELGCCDYVVKPFTKEELLARVKTHLEIYSKRRKLEAANNELSLFCSAISHDLRSPLNVTQMLADTLKKDISAGNTEDALKIASMIEGKTAKLITMIERLLSFSKMCSIEPEYETLDMNELVRDIFDECKSAEPERNITLIEGSLPQISGDDVLVRMLVKNLMTNAFKFTRHRQNAVITVSAIPDESYVVISFRDNGAGFDMAYADKLFGVFQRLHLDEEYEGSGIGLATADRIIKRHGGRIEAYGEVDKGAEFTLYFPK